MHERNIMPARTVVGFDNRRFSLFPDEITTFLINCDNHGLKTVPLIIERLEAIKAILIQHGLPEDAELNTFLINEIILSIRGVIFEDQ